MIRRLLVETRNVAVVALIGVGALAIVVGLIIGITALVTR